VRTMTNDDLDGTPI